MAKLTLWLFVFFSSKGNKIKDRLQSRLRYGRTLVVYLKDYVIGLLAYRDGYGSCGITMLYRIGYQIGQHLAYTGPVKRASKTFGAT